MACQWSRILLLYIISTIMWMWYNYDTIDIHDADDNDIIYINYHTNITSPPPMVNANCSIAWRKQYQIEINNKSLFDRTITFLYPMDPVTMYKFKKIPKGTFSYWLSHIESQNRLTDKAKFADKFLVKKYINDYKIDYPSFNMINVAEILYDTVPSFNDLRNLSEIYNGFLVKPNHFSG
eukprot:434213_1